MGSVETAGGVARSWRGTGWRGARMVRPPAQISGRCLGLELRARWRAGLCITTLAPRAPRFILAAGKPAAPADLLFGFVCASAAGADSPSFETSRPRRSAICSVCRGDALCRVCLQRSRAPCHVFPSPPRPPPPCQGGSHQLLPAPRAWAAAETRVRRQPLQGLWQVRAQPGRLGTAWEPRALPGSQAAPGPRPAFAVSMHRSRANTTPFCRRDLTSRHVGLWRVLEPVPCRGRGTTARVYRVRYSCVPCVALWRPMLCIHWHV